MALLVISCGEGAVQGDDMPVKDVDYTEVLDFCRDLAADNDYCISLAHDAANSLVISAQSGRKMSVEGPCPLIVMNTLGSLKSGSTDLGIKLEVRDTWYNAPDVKISKERRVTVEGVKTGLISAGACVIDCGKYVYFYYDGSVVAVPSEIRERFNPPLSRDKGLLKVLFIGNSFNVDATQHLPGMIQANGTSRVFMGRCYHGGCTLPDYDKNWEAANHCSYRVCRPGESIWDGDEEYDTNIRYAIEAEDWDIVTFMEYTGDKCCWTWDETANGHITSLINKVFDAHPQKRPTVMFMLTQTFAAQSDLVKNSFGGNQMKMYEAIASFAQNVLNHTCMDDVIATGTAIQNLRTSSLNEDKVQDLSRDGYHLDYGVGRYTAACCVWYNIFEPALGLRLENNSFRYSEDIEHSTLHSMPVTDDNVDLCRRAARAATENPLQLTDMSRL